MPMKQILDQMQGDKRDSEMLILCVSGCRTVAKSILLNYLTQYLTWLSPTDDDSDDQSTVFASEEYLGKEGVFVWDRVFRVQTEIRIRRLSCCPFF